MHGERRRVGGAWRWIWIPLLVLLGGAVGYVGGLARSVDEPAAGSRSGESRAPAHSLPARVPKRFEELGSVHRNRFATAHPDAEGVEAVLLTERAREEECLEGCTLALRVIPDARGRRLRDQVLRSVSPQIDVVASHPRIPPRFGRVLRRALARMQARAERTGDGGLFRILSVARAFPGAAHARNVSLVLYDHPDPRFDRDTPRSDVGGSRIVAARAESGDGDGPPALREGVLEVFEIQPDYLPPELEDGSPLAFLRGNVHAHFGSVGGPVHGLRLDASGRLWSYGPDLVEEPIEADDTLLVAVRTLLGRP